MAAIEAASVVDGDIVGDNLILTRYDSSTINAGNVRGPAGPTGPMGPAQLPTGSFIMGGWSADPTGYLILNGQTVLGGAITYSALAACFPNWVSGNNLILPDSSGCVPMGGTTPGVVSGAMTHTLTSPNQLPLHAHSMTHTHTTPDHSHAIDSHQHQSADHAHSFSGTTGGMGHELVTRWSVATSGFATGRDSDNNGILDGSTGTVGGIYVYYTGDHGHGFSGTTSGANGGVGNTTGGNMSGIGTSTYGATSGTGNTTNSQSTSNTGNTGASASIDHTPKNITVKMAVKT
jgi:hypothetical protein